MKQKKILFLHGFYASGSCVPALALKEAFKKRATVLTPDLPLHPADAIRLIREICDREKPDILVGNSCGSFYAQMISPIIGVPALLGNPHFKMSDFLRERIGNHQYKSPRADGKQDFTITEELVKEFEEVEAHQFDGCNTFNKERVWGLFGEEDTLAHFEPLFLEHYLYSYHFPGGHTPTAEQFKTWYCPLIEKMMLDKKMKKNNRLFGIFSYICQRNQNNYLMQLSTIFNKWSQTSLVLRIFVGLIIGACLGLIVPQWTGISILGIVFVSALKAIAPVLVAVLVAASIAKAGGGLGPRFRVVISRYMLSTFIAAMCAVVGSFMFPATLQLSDVVEGAAPGALTDVFSNLVTNMVSNPIASVSQANYIGILFWAILMGIALKLKASQKTIDVVQDFSHVITQTVKWVIQFAPFGILGLVFTSVSESGLEVFTTYGHLVLLLVGCMLANTLIFNPLISFLMLRRNPYPLLFTCLKESGLQAFFTRSSAANIPINMNLCKKLGLDEDFYSVSIPLGATINMDGAAVTITVMTMAVAHTVGVDVTFASALFLSIIATLGACGTSGVAGGSLLLIPMACSFFNIGNDIAMQAVGVGFIIGVIQDSVETALNSSGDVFFTATAEYYDRMKKAEQPNID